MKLKDYFTFNLDFTGKIIFGCSGGPDSIFLLLHLIHNYKKEDLIVVHVNYHTRASSNDAQKIVTEICKKNDVVFQIVNVEEKPKGNFEAWARKIRYDAFFLEAKKNMTNQVVIAHTFDDDIETYALQKQRDILVPYYGLKAVTKIEKFKIYRPMLKIKKKEILNWLKINNINYDVDITNEDDKFLRNKIRKNMNDNLIEQYQKERSSKNRMMLWVYERIELLLKPEIQLKDFYPLNDKEELVFVFEYLKRFAQPDYDITKIKKNITAEIAKELRSQKPFIQIKLNDALSLIKDRTTAFLFRNKWLAFSKKITHKNDLESIKWFSNYQEICQIFFKKGPIIVTNDFFQYQKHAKMAGKIAKKYFSNNKISYEKKLINAAIFLANDNVNIVNIIK